MKEHPSWKLFQDLMVGKDCYERLEDGTLQFWDWGQALMRECFGRNWATNIEFLKVDELSIEDPLPSFIIERAKRWDAGEIPDWVETFED